MGTSGAPQSVGPEAGETASADFRSAGAGGESEGGGVEGEEMVERRRRRAVPK